MTSPRLHSIRIRVAARLVGILNACREAGLTPVPLGTIHAIAYFADALAPVWNIPVLEAQILKKAELPLNPELQSDVDELVGRAVLIPTHIRHVQMHGGWRLDADYDLNQEFAERIISTMYADTEFERELFFTREVTLALAGLGAYGMSGAVLVDATYANPMLDVGSVVDMSPPELATRTVEVSRRFAELMASDRVISDAEMTHLYVRHLYRLLGAQR